MKNSFFLVIPKQQNEPHRLKEFEAKSIQHWIDELPSANLGLATRLIHDFLLELNSIAMSYQLRLDVLEKIRPNVNTIEDYLQERLIKSGFPKDENEKKIFEVLTSIEKECAIGYWTVLKELTHRNAGWFKGKSVALSVQRCIKKLGRIVTSHSIMRAPIPDWVWIDLHSLYALSVKTHQNSTQVEKHLNQYATTHTPTDCYLQVLLFQLADPTGLMQKEIPQVYSFIEAIADLVTLKRAPILNQPKQCLILTDEDRPPYFRDTSASRPDSAVLYLDFSKLYKFLDHQDKSSGFNLKFLNSTLGLNKQITKPPAEVLEYLQQRWFGVELEGSALFADRLDRCISVGMPAAVPPPKNPSNNSSQPAIVLEEKEEFIVQSASDRLLSGVFKSNGVLSVGSLISFKKKDDPDSKRSLGIVKKLVVTNQNNKITFGLHLITDRFYTVTCILRQAVNKDIRQNGVFYSVKHSNGERNYIITDYFMFEDNDAIDLSMEGEDFPVIMKNRKNVGLGYWQFECFRVSDQPKTGLGAAQTKKGYDFI